MKVLIDKQSVLQALEWLQYGSIAHTDLKSAIVEMENVEPEWFHRIGRYEVNQFYHKTEEHPEGCTPLYAHPAQSRDSIIEECADVAWDHYKHGPEAVDCAIRALKGK